MRLLGSHLRLAAIAGIIGAGSVFLLVLGDSVFLLPMGIALHLIAVFFCLKAAALRRKTPLNVQERDTVLYMALLVPVIGPLTAWRLPARNEREVENAHQVVERYLSHVKPKVPDYERTLFTGDFDRDLARKLDAESFVEVLRYGDVNQKRSALFKLAELGQPHHLVMIRKCLEDPDGEVRLYAYGELDRLTRLHEIQIAAARTALRKNRKDPDALKAMGRAHFGLAASGILDPRTAKFHFREAARHAQEIRDMDPSDVDALILQARAFTLSGEVGRAALALNEVPEEDIMRQDVCLARAEVAFKRRDFTLARIEAGRLLLAEEELPGWLSALTVAADYSLDDLDDWAEDEEDPGDGTVGAGADDSSRETDS